MQSSMGHWQIPEWKLRLIERRKQAKEEEKLNGYRSGLSQSQTSSMPGGRMIYRVASPPPREENQDATHLPSYSATSQQIYQNGDSTSRTPPFSPRMRNVNSPKAKHRKSSLSSVSSGGDLNSSLDRESAQTEINQDYLNGTRWSMPSEPSEPVPLEKYRPGFVNILRSKWANLLGDSATEKPKANGNLKKSSSMENLLDSTGSSSTVNSSTSSKPASTSVQTSSNDQFARSALQSKSMEALLDKPVKGSTATSLPSTSSSDYFVRNDTFAHPTNSPREPSVGNGQERHLTISIPSNQPELTNGYIPTEGPLSPSEPGRLEPEEELPRPNTVLTALNLFEKSDSKKPKYPLSPRSPTSPRSPHVHTTSYLVNGQTKQSKPVTEVVRASSPPRKDYVAPNRFMPQEKKKEEQSKASPTPDAPTNGQLKADSISASLPASKSKIVPKKRQAPVAPLNADKKKGGRQPHTVFDSRLEDPPPAKPQVSVSEVDGLQLDLSKLDEPAPRTRSFGMFRDPGPCPYTFIGDNVKLGRSSLKKKNSKAEKKLVIRFDDEPTRIEYQSELGLLEELGLEHEADSLLQEYENKVARGEVKEEEDPEDTEKAPMDSASLLKNNLVGGSAGGLSSYKSKASLDYEFGQHLTEQEEERQREQERQEAEAAVTVGDAAVAIKPAEEDTTSTWSGNSSADILF